MFCGITRLRPTNAHLLLHLAQIQPGDVVLDPCAGIGTIPLYTRGVGIGGDVSLTNPELAEIATTYQKAHTKPGRLLAWDATWLPIRSQSIDVVVSDLPFGQQCMSSGKLQTFLPLWMAEMARVLLPNSKMVLLCGAFAAIIEALRKVNHIQADSWELPCHSIIPVNIGGLLAWVIVVKRGSAVCHKPILLNHQSRVKSITTKRDHRERQRQRDLQRNPELQSNPRSRQRRRMQKY